MRMEDITINHIEQMAGSAWLGTNMLIRDEDRPDMGVMKEMKLNKLNGLLKEAVKLAKELQAE